MNKPKVSIIVPIYNAERYLCQCVDSILLQSFSDFELVLIDDGSKDSSGQICDAYMMQDTRVRVFHKENGGVSSARNMGLVEARGEWVFFSDADDEVKLDGIEILVDKVCSGAKFVIAGYEVLDEKDALAYSEENRASGYLSREEAMMQMFKPNPYRYQGYLWNKLFNRSIIEQEHLRFDASITFNEDRLFCVQYISVLVDSYQVGYTWEPVYRYIERSTGAMGSLNERFNPKFLSDLVAYKKMGQVLRSKHFSKEIADAHAESMLLSYRKFLGMMQTFGVHSGVLRLKTETQLIIGFGLKRYTRFCVQRIKRLLGT